MELSLKHITDSEYLRNKTCSPCLDSLVKTEANVWRIHEQISQNLGCSQGFSPV